MSTCKWHKKYYCRKTNRGIWGTANLRPKKDMIQSEADQSSNKIEFKVILLQE